MSKLEQRVGFYHKMAELEEKLRKSEEERLQLEGKFTLMMRMCREEEEAKLQALRERYEQFLEEDRNRRDRNDRIIQMLDRIDSRASALTAKTERLKLLRVDDPRFCPASSVNSPRNPRDLTPTVTPLNPMRSSSMYTLPSRSLDTRTPNRSYPPDFAATTSAALLQYRQLLGVGADPGSDVAGYSDMEDMEDQLANLVQQPHNLPAIPSARTAPESLSGTQHLENLPAGKAPADTQSVKTNKEVDGTSKPVTRPLGGGDAGPGGGSKAGKELGPAPESQTMGAAPRSDVKKLPALSKMLESDSESLQPDSHPSNDESDDFDFSSDKQ